MKIFGKKEYMTDCNVYWKDDVNLNDMVDDLEKISMMLMEHDGFKKGNRIVCVRNWMIDDTNWKMAELYISKAIIKKIETTRKAGGFKTIFERRIEQ